MSITSAGLTRPKLNEIKLDIDQRLTEALGPINTGPDGVLGIVSGIVAEQLDNVWEAVEYFYSSLSPATASGVFLDYLGSVVGVPRLSAAPTTVIAAVYGTEGSVVLQGTTVTDSNGTQYTADASTTVSRSSAVEVKVTVNTLASSAPYQIILDGVSVLATSAPAPTIAGVLAQLAAAINAEFYATNVTGNTLTIRAADGYSPFAVTLDSKLTLTSLASPLPLTAVADGATGLPIGGLTTVVSPPAGVSGVTNFVTGTPGRLVESDEAYRLRFYAALYAAGTGTRQGIQARLLTVPGVSYARVYENRTAFVVDGQPAHSFEAIVAGGAATAVARVIYENKPAGIETFGSVNVQVTDSNGDAAYIRFSRPLVANGWIRVTVTALNPEETLTPAAADVLRGALATYGNTLSAGDDLFPQRFYAPVYSSTQGIASVQIELAITQGSDTPVFSALPVSVPRNVQVVFSPARVLVSGV